MPALLRAPPHGSNATRREPGRSGVTNSYCSAPATRRRPRSASPWRTACGFRPLPVAISRGMVMPGYPRTSSASCSDRRGEHPHPHARHALVGLMARLAGRQWRRSPIPRRPGVSAVHGTGSSRPSCRPLPARGAGGAGPRSHTEDYARHSCYLSPWRSFRLSSRCRRRTGEGPGAAPGLVRGRRPGHRLCRLLRRGKGRTVPSSPLSRQPFLSECARRLRRPAPDPIRNLLAPAAGGPVP